MDFSGKIATVWAELEDLNQQVKSQPTKEMELLIRQQIIVTRSTLNILLSQPVLPGKKYSVHSIHIVPTMKKSIPT